MKSLHTIGLSLGCILFSFNGAAEDTSQKQQFEKILRNLSPAAFTIEQINPTPLDNISEVVIESAGGTQVFYLSSDGSFLFDGSLINTLKRENLTESTRSDMRKSYLSEISSAQRINFFPENMQHTITVFTDTDCGYCRKLHSEMDQYHELGIGISYVFFPRGGVNSPAYNTAISIWCSDDRKAAMDQSQMGQAPQQMQCDNPVQLHLDTALKSGLAAKGTPSIIAEDGQFVSGYLPPKSLKQKLDMMQ